MANTVSGPFVGITVVDGSTPANATWGNLVQTQSKVALASLNPDLVTSGFILSGALATRHNSYSSNVLADAPTRYYRLDETIGTGASDSGSGQHNAVYTGGFTLGVTGALTGDPDFAITLNGTSGYVYSAVTSDLPSGAGAFSMECWMKFAANPAASQDIYSLGDIDTANHNAFFQLQTTGFLKFLSNGGFSVTSNGALSTGAWHHVVGTYDGTTARLYIDGALQTATATVTLAMAYVGSYPFTFGSDSTGASHLSAVGGFFAGQLDEVALYVGAALSSTRVSAHYTAGTTATTQVDIASGTAYLMQSDGTLARCVIGATSETTSATNTVYYLYLQPDGSWYWSTSNAPAANSLAIAQVSTDGAGDVKVVADQRPLTINFFANAVALPTPRIIMQAVQYFVNQTALTTFLGGTGALPGGLYRVSGAFHQANVSGAENITFSATYIDLTGVLRTIYFSNGAGVVYNGATSIAIGDWPATPLVFSIQNNTAIGVNYQDPAGSPLDKVSAVIERLA